MSLVATIRRLVQAGYPESTARKIATGELPMDEASRRERAIQQGKAFDDPMIHNSPVSGILDFKPSESGRMGPGVYVTPRDDYATSLGDNRYNLVTENKPATYQQHLELKAEISKDFIDQGVDPRMAYRLAASEANKRLADQGYTTIEMTNRRTGNVDEVVILDRANIRDRDRAAFDPDEIGNPNIMASRPEAAVGGLLSAGDFDAARAALNEEEGYQYYDVLPIRKNLMGREQPYELALPNLIRDPVRALLDLSEQLETGERNPSKAMGLLF